MTGSDDVGHSPLPDAPDDRSRVRPLRTLLRYAVVAAVGSTVVTVVAAMIADSTQPDLWLSALVGLVAIVGSFSLICSIAAAAVSTGCVVALTADRGVIFLAALVTFFVVELLVIRPYSVAAAVSFFSVLPAASAAASIALTPPSRAPADVGARPGTPRTDPRDGAAALARRLYRVAMRSSLLRERILCRLAAVTGVVAVALTAPAAPALARGHHPVVRPTAVAGASLDVGALGASGKAKPLSAAPRERRVRSFLSGYTWWDNTPRGANVSHPVVHRSAGGTGTWANPITVAVGHRIVGGRDILDWPAGTRMYVPSLRRYLVVEDSCGDGSAPQNVPCHSLATAPDGVSTWVDVWVGGAGTTRAQAQDCAARITAVRDIIIDARPGHPVTRTGARNLASSCRWG